MIQEFYERYPLGRIWGDLIAIHDGQYLVRVVIFDQERPLVSSLAMGLSVETAEDLARERSLSLLAQATTVPAPIPSPSTAGESPPATVSLTPVSPAPPGNSLGSEDLYPSQPQPRPTTVLNPHPPTDDSDLLVQTTLELRRLGWDAEQGRVYLEETYGKRSRQQLTRAELESFLDYLQGQTPAG